MARKSRSLRSITWKPPSRSSALGVGQQVGEQVAARRPRRRRRRSAPPAAPGSQPASSSASQAHSRKTRCCGSMTSASRGVKPKKAASKRSAPAEHPLGADVARIGEQRGIDPGGGQLLVGEERRSTRRRRAGCARARRRRAAPGKRPARPTMAIPCRRRCSRMLFSHARSHSLISLRPRRCPRACWSCRIASRRVSVRARAGLGLLRGAGGAAAFQAARQALDGRVAEQLDDRDVAPGRLAQPALQAGDQQRVAADLEEVLLDADPVEPQDLAPDGADRPLEVVARRHVGGLRGADLPRRRAGPRGRACRWRSPAAAGSSTKVQGTMYSGSVSRRKARSSADRPAAPAPAGRHHVADQALLARHVLPRQHHRRARSAGWRSERRLDLPQLDAVAAHLDLVVDAAQELEGAVRRRSAPRSPVRYSRAPGASAKGSGTKRSAVSAGCPA